MDPIRIELKEDSLGIGKAEELMSNHVSSTAKRKAMEMEKQLDESSQQKEERVTKVEKTLAIAKELEQVKRAFYCELCDKQYKKISEYEQHLQSYDHHHKKRFKDMKESARQSNANQQEREKKLAREKKREERELKRMQDALLKRTGAAPPPPKTAPPPPLATTSSTGGWSTVNAGSGGWTSQSTTSWSTVDTNPHNTAPGGWSTVASNDNNSSKGAPTVESSSTPNKHTSDLVESKPAQASPTPAKPPATKLSFGIKKKTGGFQFGLKKK